MGEPTEKMFIDVKGNVGMILRRSDFDTLIYALGLATAGEEAMCGVEGRYRMLRLANKINEGNPDWTPYEVPNE